MRTYFLDANIFLRFLTADDRRKAADCRRVVQKAIDGELRLSTHPLIMAEVVWVLESYYGLPRDQIAAKLEMILNTPNLVISEGEAFSRAVEIYRTSDIDLADCFAAAVTEQSGHALLSYDRDFDRLEGVVRVEPGTIR